jgi:hypothetical protein
VILIKSHKSSGRVCGSFKISISSPCSLNGFAVSCRFFDSISSINILFFSLSGFSGFERDFLSRA